MFLDIPIKEMEVIIFHKVTSSMPKIESQWKNRSNFTPKKACQDQKMVCLQFP